MPRWSLALVLVALAVGQDRLHGQATSAKEAAKSADVLPSFDAAIEKLQQRIRELEAEKKAADDKIKADEEKYRANNRLPPSQCILTGRVEGDYAYLEARYKFTTFLPNTWVNLGLQGAFLADEGKLDGQFPLLKATDAGVEIYVEKPANEHQAQVGFRVPVKIRRSGVAPGTGSERTLDFGLPGAAVNSLTLDLPPSVKELRANDYQGTRLQGGRWQVLGFGPPPVERLKLTWKEPVALPGKETMLTCDGNIHVTVDDAQVETVADLVLEDLRGQTKDWHFLFPAHVQAKDIKVDAAGLPPELVEPDDNNPFFTLKFGDASRQSFKLRIHEVRALEDGRMPIGPYYLFGAYRQGGTITVERAASALQGKRLDFQRRPQVFGKASSGQPNVQAEFQYSSLPRANKGAPAAKLRHDLSFLDFQVKVDRGQYETEVEHQLNVRPAANAWEVTTTTRIKVTSQTGVTGFVDVQLPRPEPAYGLNVLSAAPLFPANVPWLPIYLSTASYWPGAGPRDFVCEQENGPPPVIQPPDELHRARIALTGAPAAKFTVILTGEYRLPREVRKVRLQLPTPVGSIDRGARITAEIDDQHEFTLHGASPTPFKQQRLEWETSRTPEMIDLGWRPYVPELFVDAVVDVTIHEHYARVRQELRIPLQEETRDRLQRPVLQFQIPAEVKNLRSTMYGHDPATRLASALIQPDEPLIMEYSVTVPPDGDAAFALPMIWPVKATRLDAKVRVWTPAGMVPRVENATEAWDNLFTEFVPGRDTLPGLVLRGSGNKLPLVLRVEHPPDAKVADVVFDRGLIDVRLEPNGEQLYRLRFLVQKLNTDLLTIGIPGSAAEVIQSIRLNDTDLAWSIGAKGKVLLHVSPELVAHNTILDLRYKLPATSSDSSWQTVLRLPKFHGDVLIGRIRWQIISPKVNPEVTAFVFDDDAQVEYRWGLQNNWLPAPLPAASSAELERWLTDGRATAAEMPANLLFWRTSLEPVCVWHVSQPVLFAVCSSVFLLLGLGLHLAPISRYSFWLLVALLGLTVVAAGMLWPSVVPVVIFACQPGLVILVLILTVQWMLHERYRRQLIFLPGFTRRKSASSIVKRGQKRREASTIDAPKGAQLSNVGQGT